MSNIAKLERFSRFAVTQGYCTTLYRSGQPLGVYIDNAWCYIKLTDGIITTIPQPLKKLFKAFEDHRPIASYVERPKGQRRRLKIKHPDVV
jgi:hypothetical protein